MTKIPTMAEVFISNNDMTRAVSAAMKAGSIRKIGPRLYTNNVHEDPSRIVKRNIWLIAQMLFPGAVVSHRTAFEINPTVDGSIFLSGAYPRIVKLPGVTFRQLAGPGPLDGDQPYYKGLYLGSRARTFLENMQPSKNKHDVKKTVERAEIERRLVDLMNMAGPEGVYALRRQAEVIAPALGLSAEYEKLNKMVGALLRTQDAELTTEYARLYTRGDGYDPDNLMILETLFAALGRAYFPTRSFYTSSPSGFSNISFFDAYFSNYIEGTEFELEEAIKIVFDGEVPPRRPADAQDVIGTYKILSDRIEMTKTPSDFYEFLAIIRARHSVLMAGRPEIQPGHFKDTNNRVGGTTFVPPHLVTGTLKKGFSLYQQLRSPMAKALFIKFLIVAVHPFTDGNGRVSRIMMNAELISANQNRIIIPSVYRNEYINSLSNLSNNAQPESYIRVMGRAQEFVALIDFSDFELAVASLEESHAFERPDGVNKLLIPKLPNMRE
jgi:hypothetical protein